MFQIFCRGYFLSKSWKLYSQIRYIKIFSTDFIFRKQNFLLKTRIVRLIQATIRAYLITKYYFRDLRSVENVHSKLLYKKMSNTTTCRWFTPIMQYIHIFLTNKTEFNLIKGVLIIALKTFQALLFHFKGFKTHFAAL